VEELISVVELGNSSGELGGGGCKPENGTAVLYCCCAGYCAW
jgi:hypothetical protein